MPTFTPQPTTIKATGGRAADNRPYTAMYVSGLNIGLTHSELRTMRYPFLVNLLHSYIELNKPQEETRTATQQDIDMYL